MLVIEIALFALVASSILTEHHQDQQTAVLSLSTTAIIACKVRHMRFRRTALFGNPTLPHFIHAPTPPSPSSFPAMDYVASISTDVAIRCSDIAVRNTDIIVRSTQTDLAVRSTKTELAVRDTRNELAVRDSKTDLAVYIIDTCPWPRSTTTIAVNDKHPYSPLVLLWPALFVIVSSLLKVFSCLWPRGTRNDTTKIITPDELAETTTICDVPSSSDNTNPSCDDLNGEDKSSIILIPHNDDDSLEDGAHSDFVAGITSTSSPIRCGIVTYTGSLGPIHVPVYRGTFRPRSMSVSSSSSLTFGCDDVVIEGTEVEDSGSLTLWSESDTSSTDDLSSVNISTTGSSGGVQSSIIFRARPSAQWTAGTARRRGKRKGKNERMKAKAKEEVRKEDKRRMKWQRGSLGGDALRW